MKIPILQIALGLCLLAACAERESTVQEPEAVDQPTVDSSYIGPHHSHHQLTAHHDFDSEAQWDSLNGYTPSHSSKPVRSDLLPGEKTFGWHLYSKGSRYREYHFNLLWGISYFSYFLDPATGSYKDIHQWKTTALVDSAQAAGTKVFLTVSNFGESANTQFLDNAAAQTRLGDSLVALLHERSADGVNLDFEGMGAGMGPKFTDFVKGLSERLKAENPEWMVTVALYAVDRHKVFQVAELSPHVDLFTLMAYDYYGGFSHHAGPVSPLYSSSKWGESSVEASVNYYLGAGMAKEKLLVGLPYYGHKWQTDNADTPGKVVKSDGAVTYSKARGEFPRSLVRFDSLSATGFVVQELGDTWQQTWFDDSLSLSRKFQWVRGQGLGGIGIWALGYDEGTNALWDVVEEEFGK